ncbi:unnamed protein product (macronuclear) [Paramecium tetraurelia]|uniref:B box-type domain-containing protein n=1 Tax=Paramecium tetraurelia TaxID=5888 RepID=A0DUP7_PARTE|nr:uncharacterized protein GSPATT00020436001 [Paramecium tetraurelia]CAK86764.1 unnamed protein product [Paramecium tetraurelia]|eukprot:XP_001454161.1 hypothetical protein (macronuclear) [Paramecium tetraurelia strain d4-2]
MDQSELKCQHLGHENGQILGVCTVRNCQGKRPFCLGCKYEFHNEHKDSLKKFEELVNWINENSIAQNKLQEVLNKLKELIQCIEKQIKSTQEDVDKKFTQMNYTTLDNSINNFIKIWEVQKEVQEILERKSVSFIIQQVIVEIKLKYNHSQSPSQNLVPNHTQLPFKEEGSVQKEENSQKLRCQTPYACNQINNLTGQNREINNKYIFQNTKQNRGDELPKFNIQQLQQKEFPGIQQNQAFQNKNQFIQNPK